MTKPKPKPGDPPKPHKPRPMRKPHKQREENALADDVKRRIVMELAAFRTTGEVKQILAEEYDIMLEVKDVGRYDASKGYCIVGETLRNLFHQTRKEYVEGIADLHITNQNYRLRRLMEMSLRAERAGDIELAAKLLEQAAKDHGGAYTNERKVSGQVDHRHKLTPDQARERIAQFVAAERSKPNPKTKH